MQELKEAGRVYPCFCSDEELDAMRAAAEAANLPPVYNGKWARASAEDVAAEMEKGTPFCYRFRVPANKTVVVRDLVRGDVTFNTDTLGDFVVMRSNGLPVRTHPRAASAPGAPRGRPGGRRARSAALAAPLLCAASAVREGRGEGWRREHLRNSARGIDGGCGPVEVGGAETGVPRGCTQPSV